MRRRRLFSQEFTISVEAALKNLSDVNFDWELPVEEIVLGTLNSSDYELVENLVEKERSF